MDGRNVHSLSSSDQDHDAEPRGGRGGRCGWGPCAPVCLQPAASVWAFIACYFGFAFVHGVQGSYTIAMLTTLERRFNLPSSMSGSLAVMSTVGYAGAIIFVSHFGKNAHIPRMFSLSILVTSFCGFMYAWPHIIYGTGNEDIDAIRDVTALNVTTGDVRQAVPTQYCRENGSLSCLAKDAGTGSVGPDVSMNVVAFSMFAVSEIIHGVAGSPIWSVGIFFIDSNTEPQLSSQLLGNTANIPPLINPQTPR